MLFPRQRNDPVFRFVIIPDDLIDLFYILYLLFHQLFFRQAGLIVLQGCNIQIDSSGGPFHGRRKVDTFPSVLIGLPERNHLFRIFRAIIVPDQGPVFRHG